MKITKAWLEEKGAFTEGKAWFVAKFPKGWLSAWSARSGRP